MKDFIAKCDELMKTGRLPEAVALLNTLELKEVPRKSLLDIALLCRRANLLNLGLRALNPVVHERLGGEKASPGELAEYAVLLQRCGGVREALNILSRHEVQGFAQTPLYRAYCLFNLWEYAGAIPHLQNYLAGDLAPYARLIGETNLAAAFNFAGRGQEGAALAALTAEKAAAGGYTRLQCNNLELLAHACFEAGDFKAAREAVDKAASVLGGVATIDQLYIRKWNAALKAVGDADPRALTAFRAEALSEKHFESVREADLLSLRVRFDEELFGKLYFGTPFSGYRSRIERLLGRTMESEECVIGAPGAAVKLDLQTGECTGAEFPVGTKIHQCIEVLSRDTYKPFSVGAMFSELFPGEYFDIESSPNRVHQVVSRTRQWLEDNKFPIALEEQDGRYFLKTGDGIEITKSKETRLAEWEAVQIKRLKKKFKEGSVFSAGEIRDALNLSPSNFKRLSAWATEQGALDKKGKRAGTLYVLKGKSA